MKRWTPWWANWHAKNANSRRRTTASSDSPATSNDFELKGIKPRKAHVSREMFAVFITLVVVMVGASDVALVLATRGPSASDVKRQILREIRANQDRRDAQLCAGAHLTRRLRHVYRCTASPPPLPPTPAVTSTTTVTVPGRPVPIPGPTSTRTVTRPGPTRTACHGVRVNGGCVPTRIPTPLPSLRLGG